MSAAGEQRAAAGRQAAAGGTVLFYNPWPLGYHNLEAQRKALAFARGGHEVVWVTSVGTRNPRLSSLRKLADLTRRKLRRPAGAAPTTVDPRLRTAALLVTPPRQLAAVERLNVAWVERQLRRAVADWDRTLAWVRWPSQELVAALPRLRPRAVVYEAYDANHLTPGITGRWVEVFERADRELARLADLVVAPSEPLAARYRPWAREVRIVPHGVDLFPWAPRARRPDEPITIGFVGTLDYKLELPVLRAIARAHPDWRLRLVGPIQEGFDPAALADLPNVTVEPPVPASEVGATIGAFDAGLMPYYDHPHYAHSCPLKNLEYLAAGRPAVARAAPALAPFADLVRFADTPAEFVRELELAVAQDTPELARRRRAVAEQNTWERRLGELQQIVQTLLEPSRNLTKAPIP